MDIACHVLSSLSGTQLDTGEGEMESRVFLATAVTILTCEMLRLPRGGQVLPGQRLGYLLLCCQGWAHLHSYLRGREAWEVPGGHSPQTQPLASKVSVEGPQGTAHSIYVHYAKVLP